MPTVSRLRSLARQVVPFGLRREIVCLRRLPRWVIERPGIAGEMATLDEAERFTWLLADHSSPLERTLGSISHELQQGKENNVRLAAAKLDGLIVAPNQIFSHHHTIGRTTRRRGFRKGLELQNGEARGSWGGGLCQVSNSFYWVAVRAGMRIVERHRHGLDLFPDDKRTVPFGCGATVVYNYADFRFENPLSQPVMLAAHVDNGNFVSRLWAIEDPGFRVDVDEVDHRFVRVDDGWVRENKLRRRIRSKDADWISDVEIAHNKGRVLYEPPADEVGADA